MAVTGNISQITLPNGNTYDIKDATARNAIANLPEPMVFKGSLGTGGTITSLPVDGSAKIGDTYKVITAGTYASLSADVGDTFICDSKTSSTNTWTLIPSGDEPSGTVTSVGVSATSPIVASGSPITSSGTISISHANSGATAGSYGDSSALTPGYGSTFKVPYVTVNATGHVTGISEHTVKIPASDNTDTQYNLTLNGTTNGDSGGTSLGTLYAPTGAGTSGQVLKSSGSGAPSWGSLTLDSVSDGSNRKLTDYVTIATTQTITGVKTFNPSSGDVPFVLNSGKTGTVLYLNADRVDSYHANAITNIYSGTNCANGTSGDFWFKAAEFYLSSNSTLDVKATFLVTSYFDYSDHPGIGILSIHARGNNATTPFDTDKTKATWSLLNSALNDVIKVKTYYDNSGTTIKRYIRIYTNAGGWNRGVSVKLLNSQTWKSTNSTSWTMYNTPSTIATAADYSLGTELTITSNLFMFDANGGIKYSSGGSDTTFWNTNGGTKTAAEILSSAGGVTTDNKVFLATSTTTDYRPIILGKSTSSTESGSFSNTTDLSYYSNSLRVQPSTGNIISAGNVKAQTLSISSTSGVAHLDFARGAYNYILAKASGGKLCFIVNGQTLSTANCEAIIEDGAIYPGTTNVTDLGKSSFRWKNLYVTNINGITIPTDGTFSPIDRSVAQLYTSSALNDAYRVLLSYLADDSDHTTSVRKSPKLTFNPSTGVLAVTGKVNASDGFFQTSDITKKNVKGELDLDKAYELIDKCQTIIYSLKDDKSNKEQIGLIALEVKEFFPEIVEETDGVLSLDYARLTVVILRVLKDLINRVKKLEG